MQERYLVVTKIENKKVFMLLRTTNIYTIREFSNIASAYNYWLENRETSFMAKKIEGKVHEC